MLDRPLPTVLLLAGAQTLSACRTVPASAHPPRRGYSTFGMGYEMLSYEENTTRRFDGETVDIENDELFSLTNNGAAYVAINPTWGFHLTTYSTLGKATAAEQWQIQDETVVTNKVAIERQGLGLVGTYRVRPSGYFLLGVQYENNDFERFATTLTPKAAQYGIDEDSITTGTVSESVWSLSLVTGYELSDFFTSEATGWRYFVRGTIGLPLLTSISNTEIDQGEAFMESFNGYQVRLDSAIGYQFHKSVIASFGLDLGRSFREAIGVEDDTELPENVLFYIYPSLSLNWSF